MNNKMMKFLKYLYPTDEIRDFMCNDLYQELNEVIPNIKCFCSDNVVKSVREENRKFVKTNIVNFIENNPVYKQEIEKLYKSKVISNIIDDIFTGYVLYVVNTSEKNKGENIFTNKKSICYSEGPNLLDIL